jgi:ferredoxin
LLCGRARLAVDASACRHCGLCLSGCVYGAIYSTVPEMEKLSRAGEVRYESGCVIERIEEADQYVAVFLRRVDTRDPEELRFDHVFAAAGAIQSTRIALASLQLLDQPVLLKDSQKFILPLLRLHRFPLAWPNSVSLAGAFVEFKMPRISDHWIHMQISSVNDYVLKHLHIPPWRDGARRRMLAPLYERLLIGWGGLHSDQSSGIVLTLTKDTRFELPVLRMRRQINPLSDSIARKAGRHFARLALRARTWAIAQAMIVGPPGGGNHFGGTLPMRKTPVGRLETDLLGRLRPWRRTHIVDGAILPSIPATTLALLQMANADRIAASCDLN